MGAFHLTQFSENSESGIEWKRNSTINVVEIWVYPHELSYFSEYVPFVRFCSGPVTPAENRLRFFSCSGKLVDGQVS